MMDEATSSVDAETDALIQNLVKTEFADVTVSAKPGRVDQGADMAASVYRPQTADSCIL